MYNWTMMKKMTKKYTKEEILSLYDLDLDELMKRAEALSGNEVEFCSLISAKTGVCSENCRYCAQSAHHKAEIETHPLVEVEKVLKTALEARKNHATRFAIVTSGKRPPEKDFSKMLEMIEAINSVEGLTSCASIGIVTEEQIIALKNANLRRFHHNINTCKSYYKSVCTSHTYEDRIRTIELVKKHGLELCCGVILGMGETREQRAEMALELAEISPESIPVNLLTPIKGTPFESYIDKITEDEILRTLAIFKIAVPDAKVRFAGGRSLRLSKKNRDYALKHCVESILIGNYLTTTGISPNEDIKTVQETGKKVLCTIT